MPNSSSASAKRLSVPRRKQPPWHSGSAVISDDGRYRYELHRMLQADLLGSKGTVTFCMLNPSTADANTDDPTIRRCVAYARSWGYGELSIVNLFPFRATSPRDLKAWWTAPDAFSAMGTNYMHVGQCVGRSRLLVAAWGQHGRATPPAETLLRMYNWWALGLNQDGTPVHPLYQPAYAKPKRLVKEEHWVLV